MIINSKYIFFKFVGQLWNTVLVFLIKEKGTYKMINKIKELGKGIITDYRVTGLSTAFFGISWEKINKTDKQDVMRELYLIRRKLSHFYFSYQDNLIRLEEDELLEAYFLKAFQVYDEIAESVLGSKFFVQLPIEKRQQFLNVFDNVAYYDVCMENDTNYYMEQEDIQEMINDLLNVFIKIDDEINKIESTL